MVRLRQGIVSGFRLFLAGFIMAIQLGSVWAIFHGQKAVAQSGSVKTVVSSSNNSVSSRWIMLRDHALHRDDITWPTWPTSCTSLTGYKSIPFYPWQYSAPGVTFESGVPHAEKGDYMYTAGACPPSVFDIDDFRDAGGNAWFRPGAFGGWANYGSPALSELPSRDPFSNKLDGCSLIPGNPSRIWGRPQYIETAFKDDNAYGPNGLFARNGRTVPVYYHWPEPDNIMLARPIILFSHGTTLFHTNFSLSAEELAGIQGDTQELWLDAIADDWIKVWINGFEVDKSNYAQGRVQISNSALKGILKDDGTNVLAMQITDKSAWNFTGTFDGYGYGGCFALNLYGEPAPPITTVRCDRFITDRTSVLAGTEAATVSWQTSGASGRRTYLNGSLVANSGSRSTGVLTSPATYTLEVTNPPNSDACPPITIGVTGAPVDGPGVPRKLGPWDMITNLPPVF